MSAQEPQTESSTPSTQPAQRRGWVLAALIGVPLLPLLWLLINWWSSGAELHYTSLFTATGELNSTATIGQTITPRYAGLSGIAFQLGERSNQLTGTLHLRITGLPDGQDIEATLPKAGIGDVGPVWFNFSPLPATVVGRQIGLEVRDDSGLLGSSATIFSYSTVDSYGGGTAYINGQALPQYDFIFATRYNAAPLEVWGGQLATWAGQMPGSLVLLGVLAALLTVAGTALLLVLLALRLRGGVGARAIPPLLQLLLLVAIGLANAATWAVFMPPWHGPDETAHLANAALIAKYGYNTDKTSDAALRASVVASMDRHQFTRYVPWTPYPGASADLFLARPGVFNDTLWVQTRQPRPYYWYLATVYRVLGLQSSDADWPNEAQVGQLLYAGRLASALLQGLLVGLAWLGGRILRVRGLAGAMGLMVALLPMPVFIHSTVNNDALGSIAGALLAIYAFRAIQKPALIDLPLLLIGAALAFYSKATALPVLALAGLGLLGGIWLRGGRVPKRALAGALALAIVVPAVLFYLSIDTDSHASNWLDTQLYAVPRAASADAEDGSHVLVLDNALATQRVLLPAGHGVISATATIWARGENRSATLLLGYNLNAYSGAGSLRLNSGWQLITAGVTLPAEATWINLGVEGRGGVAQFDSASLTLRNADGTPLDPQTSNWVANPSFEVAARTPPTNIPGIAKGSLGFLLLDYLVDPVGLDRFWLKQSQFWRSFWGDFGWVTVELPDWTYVAWGGVLLLGLVGAALLVARRTWKDRADLALLALVSVATILATGLFSWLRASALLKSLGNEDFPQGRYLFPFLLPFVAVLIYGLQSLWGALRGRLNGGQARLIAAWGVYTGAALLVAFGVLAFLAIMVFYYGH